MLQLQLRKGSEEEKLDILVVELQETGNIEGAAEFLDLFQESLFRRVQLNCGLFLLRVHFLDTLSQLLEFFFLLFSYQLFPLERSQILLHCYFAFSSAFVLLSTHESIKY